MRAQSSFFSQGYDLFKVYDPFISELTNTAEALKKESCVEMDKMSKRHSLVVTQHLQVCVCACVYVCACVCV